MGGLKASEHRVMGWGSCLGKITSCKDGFGAG